jgi:hypothetical protein
MTDERFSAPPACQVECEEHAVHGKGDIRDSACPVCRETVVEELQIRLTGGKMHGRTLACGRVVAGPRFPTNKDLGRAATATDMRIRVQPDAAVSDPC